MKHFILIWCAVVALFSNLVVASAANPNEPSRPKLVVGIVVDQMRWDYLYRYYDMYGEGGFKRLLSDGFSCENTMINYIPTYTAVGHTSVYTGSVPAIHGIAGNNFYDERTGQWLYCTGDDSVTPVGTTSEAGLESPRNLLVTTITDELRLATNFRSKVIGVALKDRGAILPAGHCANAAYWFDESTGGFITSSYYMDALPKWLEKFNKKDLAGKYLKEGWKPLYSLKSYNQATEDDVPYEKSLSSGAPTLPLKTGDILKEKGYGIIKSVPMGNTLTADLAKEVLANEKLGQGSEADFLCVSFSSTDYVGHTFGVNAVETQDTYLRLDKDLADFLTYLDENIGVGNYLLFLTADHAGAHNIKYLQDRGIPADGWEYRNDDLLEAAIVEKFGVSNLLRGMSNYQVHLNKALAEEKGVDFQALKDFVVDYMQQQDAIQFAFDMDKVGNAPVPELIRQRAINGYNRHRSGVIQLILMPGWYSVSRRDNIRGTTHGLWNPYDSHIPLLFYGWRIPSGSTNAEVHITDISATLAALLHIQMPSGCIGTPILPLVER